uniref:Uncharacterized protein n=1 Tax=Picea glauca TaxID=3330 RepID=A0A101LUQ8_PICGL|nr:hypothetical protein ABT39_MTgene2281 [Picea glauca]KUM45718.1 hypothetical protein ABT39_MTgene2284 [Picea glauca]
MGRKGRDKPNFCKSIYFICVGKASFSVSLLSSLRLFRLSQNAL